MISSTAPTYTPRCHLWIYGIPRQGGGTANQMDGEVDWWTTSGKIGLPPLGRVKGVGRQHHNHNCNWCITDTSTTKSTRQNTHDIHKRTPSTTRITGKTKITAPHTPTILHTNTRSNTQTQETITFNNTNYTTYINKNSNTINNAQLKTNMKRKRKHTTIVNTYHNSRNHNEITNTKPVNAHHSETTRPREPVVSYPNSEQINVSLEIVMYISMMNPNLRDYATC